MTPSRRSGPILDNPEIERFSEAIDAVTLGAGALEPGTPQPIRSIVYDRILACADGGPSTAFVSSWAQAVATVFRGQVWPLHVVEPDISAAAGYAPVADAARAERYGQQALDWLASELRSAKVVAHPTLRRGFATSQILALATETGANLIVTGSHGSGPLGRALLGSTSDGVKNHADASVLIARDLAPPASVLLPTDGSRPSRQAGIVALGLAQAWRVPLLVLHVVKAIASDPATETQTFRQTFGQLRVPPWKDSRVTFEARTGRPVDTILRAAASMDRPLVVIGSRGLSGLRSLVPGSVTNAVAHRSEQSLLVVK